jgi:valacyclovir hydrolase
LYIEGSAFTDFKPQIESLPKLIPDYKIIVVDPVGYGKSIPPKRNFTKDFLEKDADVVKELMDVLNIPKFNALGWSDGGITGLILAGKYPQNIEKLMIFGSNAYIVEEELKVYESIRDISKWSVRMREPLEKLYGHEYFKEKWEEWVDTFKLIYKENNGNLCKEFVEKIIAETLILHGEKDPMIAKEHVPYLLANIRNSKLITWPDGKHNIHIKYADDFNKKIAEFLMK